MRADDPDNVIYLGSFSKTFAPGLRVGWVLAPHAVREKLVLANEAATLNPPVFNQMLISRYLAKFDWLSQVKAYRHTYAERRDAMLGALQAHMPEGTTWTNPDGGFYVWVTLPEGFDAAAMLPRAVTARVAYVPGTAFYADGLGSRQTAAVVLLPDVRPHRRGHPPTGHRAGQRTRRDAHLRHHHVAPGTQHGIAVAGHGLTASAVPQAPCRESRPQHTPDLPRRLSR